MIERQKRGAKGKRQSHHVCRKEEGEAQSHKHNLLMLRDPHRNPCLSFSSNRNSKSFLIRLRLAATFTHSQLLQRLPEKRIPSSALIHAATLTHKVPQNVTRLLTCTGVTTGRQLFSPLLSDSRFLRFTISLHNLSLIVNLATFSLSPFFPFFFRSLAHNFLMTVRVM